jgi:hypothetical protein
LARHHASVVGDSGLDSCGIGSDGDGLSVGRHSRGCVCGGTSMDGLDILSGGVGGCGGRRLALVRNCSGSAHEITSDKIACPAINLIS